jgi:pimeloyl-ACP methyl ester carboxylesterase
MDLPNFSRTGPIVYREGVHTVQARTAVALLDALGIARAYWVGNSQGGQSAMVAAVTYPERVGKFVMGGSHIGTGGDRYLMANRAVRPDGALRGQHRDAEPHCRFAPRASEQLRALAALREAGRVDRTRTRVPAGLLRDGSSSIRAGSIGRPAGTPAQPAEAGEDFGGLRFALPPYAAASEIPWTDEFKTCRFEVR